MDNDERLIILKMVQDGKITVEQALELLNALDGEGKGAYDVEASNIDETTETKKGDENADMFPQSVSQRPHEPESAQKPGPALEPKPSEPPLATKEDNLVDKILGSLFGNGLVNLGMAPFAFSKTFTIPVQEGMSFTLKGKNGHIELIPSSEQDMRLEIKWRKRVDKPDGVDVFKKSDDEWDMDIADDIKMVVIDAYVPARRYGNIGLFTSNGHIKICPIDCLKIEAVTSNAAIDVSQARSRSSLHLTTSNGHVNADNCEGPLLWAHTSNAHIDVVNGRYEQVDLMTSNAHIKVEGVKAQEARINTSNGRIMADNCGIDDIFIKTSNADIAIQDLWVDPDVEKAKVEAITSNGDVDIRVKNKDERAYDVNAATSHGRAAISLPGINISSSYQAVATSNGYGTASRKMFMQVRSSNGNISIE